MPEMPRPREHHGNAVVISGLNNFIVANRAAGLNYGCRASFDRHE